MSLSEREKVFTLHLALEFRLHFGGENGIPTEFRRFTKLEFDNRRQSASSLSNS